MRTHKITIKPLGGERYKVKVDEKDMFATSVDLHMDVSNVPEVDIGLVGEPDMEVDGLVQFDFTPRTVKSATNLLKAALIKNDITAFLAMHSLNKVMSEIKKEK